MKCETFEKSFSNISRAREREASYLNIYILHNLINCIMKLKDIYFMPKTKIGKISFWLVICGVLVIILMNIIVGQMQKNDICNAEDICQPAPGDWEANQTFVLITNIIPSLLAMGCILIAGITSIVAIIKYKDRAIFLFISALIGLLGILFVIGEFAVPH